MSSTSVILMVFKQFCIKNEVQPSFWLNNKTITLREGILVHCRQVGLTVWSYPFIDVQRPKARLLARARTRITRPECSVKCHKASVFVLFCFNELKFVATEKKQILKIKTFDPFSTRCFNMPGLCELLFIFCKSRLPK